MDETQHLPGRVSRLAARTGRWNFPGPAQTWRQRAADACQWASPHAHHWHCVSVVCISMLYCLLAWLVQNKMCNVFAVKGNSCWQRGIPARSLTVKIDCWEISSIGGCFSWYASLLHCHLSLFFLTSCIHVLMLFNPLHYRKNTILGHRRRYR